jgi:regulator of protease activity HflC (stomatin/prohibitin superfamily)
MAKYPEIHDDKPLPPGKRGLWLRIRRHIPRLSIVLMTALLITIVLWPYVVITVPTGQVGVLWYRIIGFDTYCWCIARGTVLNPLEIREEGLHPIAPWNKLFLYDLRLQSETQTYNAISKDGVSMTVQINVRFQLVHNAVPVLHKFIGEDYFATVVSPEIGSQTRQVISHYTAQQVYISRESIQDEIRENSQRSLGANLNRLAQPEAVEQPDPEHYNNALQNSIQILDTLVLSIELPPAIVAAINRQTEQFYLIQEYKFRVQREAQESERKQIEANGIAAFQRTVSQGISDSYLRWRGIEATLALAQSPNAKIVIIGSNKDGLPVILGNVDAPAQQTGSNGALAPSAAAPTDKASPGAAATTPSDGSSEAESSTKQANSTTPAGPASTDKAPNAGGYSLSDIQAILSRLSGAIRSTGSTPPSDTAPKQ